MNTRAYTSCVAVLIVILTPISLSLSVYIYFSYISVCAPCSVSVGFCVFANVHVTLSVCLPVFPSAYLSVSLSMHCMRKRAPHIQSTVATKRVAKKMSVSQPVRRFNQLSVPLKPPTVKPVYCLIVTQSHSTLSAPASNTQPHPLHLIHLWPSPGSRH